MARKKQKSNEPPPAAPASQRPRRGRPPKRKPGEPAVETVETLQTSIRLSREADTMLDRLVEYLNKLREEGAEEHNRTSVLEDALMDYYPEWQRTHEGRTGGPAEGAA